MKIRTFFACGGIHDPRKDDLFDIIRAGMSYMNLGPQRLPLEIQVPIFFIVQRDPVLETHKLSCRIIVNTLDKKAYDEEFPLHFTGSQELLRIRAKVGLEVTSSPSSFRLLVSLSPGGESADWPLVVEVEPTQGSPKSPGRP